MRYTTLLKASGFISHLFPYNDLRSICIQQILKQNGQPGHFKTKKYKLGHKADSGLL